MARSTAICSRTPTPERVAASMQVPLIDLQAESIAYLDKIGPSAGEALGITRGWRRRSTIPNKTHLNWQGSYVFGRMVAVDLGKTVPALAKYVQPQPAELPGGRQARDGVIHQEPFRSYWSEIRLSRKKAAGVRVLRNADTERHLRRSRAQRPEYEELHR